MGVAAFRAAAGAPGLRFRRRRHSPREKRAAELAARRFGLVEWSLRQAVAAADGLRRRVLPRHGERLLRSLTGAARKAVRPDLVPEWLPQIPAAAAKRLPATPRRGAAAVY